MLWYFVCPSSTAGNLISGRKYQNIRRHYVNFVCLCNLVLEVAQREPSTLHYDSVQQRSDGCSCPAALLPV